MPLLASNSVQLAKQEQGHEQAMVEHRMVLRASFMYRKPPSKRRAGIMRHKSHQFKVGSTVVKGWATSPSES